MVKQWLKRVEVVAVDNGYVDICVAQFVRDIEAGKPGSDYYYLFFHSFIMFAACAYLGQSALEFSGTDMSNFSIKPRAFPTLRKASTRPY